jgi:hypothetical protein
MKVKTSCKICFKKFGKKEIPVVCPQCNVKVHEICMDKRIARILNCPQCNYDYSPKVISVAKLLEDIIAGFNGDKGEK